MGLINLIIRLGIVGFLLWLFMTYVPMDATIKKIITFVVILVVIIWLLNVFGIFGHDIPVPRLRP